MSSAFWATVGVMTMRERPLLVVQHVEVEGLGLLGELVAEQQLATKWIGPSDALPASAIEDASGVIVLGGPMGVYEADRHPRLRAEMDLLAAAVARKVPVLGICLGSQLLAAALGARVYPGERKELGWFDVTLSAAAADDALFQQAPTPFPALHWHGDVFELPRGATHLASSVLTVNQAFSYGGTAWGLLFHLEARLAEVQAMTNAFSDEVAAVGVAPSELLASTARHADDVRANARAIFGAWLRLVA